ncbi:MAG: helix-turn-helix transcriptional regulator [Xenococcaceae cyanobacterium MO_188.B32]|nr:helix-turn-helix transcriptional regulator [Xenococcaceae cyanobacterium MO_188.B32]
MKEFNKKKLATLVKDKIASLGLSQREFAALAKLPSSSTVNKLVSGFYNDEPELKTLRVLALNIFNVSMGEFIAYLYDEKDGLEDRPLSSSLVEIGIGEIDNLHDLSRVCQAIADRLEELEESEKQEVRSKK